ncbi:hypothetical protein [Tranquillimonas alkanivorans]|uniref:CVNH domain-containing protein n=1 Tax=Tranquillimonas alkanivorans TaxID=441119 RepID=A0A1I5PJ24_9RHOB|nr:hypothetical protein [Tranquillimonas alkanivorans]SFP33810.1 hypothetical protein SAMN04488047_105120 [Tranquillimonas alkanivorans]
MRLRRGWTAALCLLASPALGQGAFDGLYMPSPTTDCSVSGVEGGALRIEEGVFYGVESECRMTQPVDVRDMNAQLFDMECEGEGLEWTQRAFVMAAADGGLVMAWDGFAFKYDRCPDGALTGTVTRADEIGVTNGE